MPCPGASNQFLKNFSTGKQVTKLGDKNSQNLKLGNRV